MVASMEIFGKKIDLAFTVGVYEYICNQCDGHNFSKLGEWLSPEDSILQTTRIKALAIKMHKAAFQRRLCEDGVPVSEWPHYDGIDALLDNLTFGDYCDLSKEIFAVIKRDSGRRVETVEATGGGKKKEEEAKASPLNG